MAATLREYLVSLGAEVDQKSFNKFKAALHTSSLTVAKAGAAMVALTTVLVKTSLSIDETGRKYEAMAKKANKTTGEIRAQETALKTLGKTMDEIKADERLKAQYDSLEKLGKSMSLPGAQSGVQTLRNIVQTVNELRVVGTYAMQWINHYMLSRVRAPLDDLRRRLEKIKDNIKNNLPDLSSKIGNFLGNFLRLVEAGAHGVSDLIAKVGELPDGIKAIGAALSGAFAFNKMGAVGWILAGLTAILGLLDDYYTYKRGGISLLGDLWKSFEDGTTGEYVMEKLGGLLEGIQHFSESFAEIIGGLDFGGMLGGAIEKGGNIISGILNFLFGDNAAQTAAEQQGLIDTLTISVTNVISALGGVLERAMFRDNGEKFGNLINRIFAKIGEYFTADENGNTPLKTLLGAGFDLIENALNGIMDFLLGGLAGLNLDQIGVSINTVIGSVLDLIMTALDRGVKALTGYGDKQGLGGKLLDFIRSLLSNLGTLIKGIPFDQIGANIGSFASELFAKIGDFFNQEAEKAAEGKSLFGNLATVLSRIVNGVLTLVSSALGSIKPKDLSGFVNGLWRAITMALNDLSRRLTTEGDDKIDVEGIGQNLGSAIGSVIVIGTDFLLNFAQKALEWATGDGLTVLFNIGQAIVEGIWAGLSSLVGRIGDWLGEKLFGEEGWAKMKEDYDNLSPKKEGPSGENDDNGMVAQGKAAVATVGLALNPAFQNQAESLQGIHLLMTDKERYEAWVAAREMSNARGFANIEQMLEADRKGQEERAAQKKAQTTAAEKTGTVSDVLKEYYDTQIPQIQKTESGFDGWASSLLSAKDGLDEINKILAKMGREDLTITVNVDFKANMPNIPGLINKDLESINILGYSEGARVDSERTATVGEGNKPEYIIPITNLSRARQLILQMFQEMGSNANSILDDLGAMSGSGSNAGGPGMPASMQPAGMYPSAGGAITSNSGNTVSAPTTINVYGSGDPVAAGNAAAKASENNIIRRIRGCFEQ